MAVVLYYTHKTLSVEFSVRFDKIIVYNIDFDIISYIAENRFQCILNEPERCS